MEWEIDIEMQERQQEGETKKLRENVIWSGCFGLHAPFALPDREGDWRALAGIESVD